MARLPPLPASIVSELSQKSYDFHILLQSSQASAAALKHVASILVIRYRTLKQAQRPGMAAKLAKKAARQGQAMRDKLITAFQWSQQAQSMSNDLRPQGEGFVAATLAEELPDESPSILRWLSNQWLRQHCGAGANLGAAVRLAAASLLGDAGMLIAP